MSNLLASLATSYPFGVNHRTPKEEIEDSIIRTTRQGQTHMSRREDSPTDNDRKEREVELNKDKHRPDSYAKKRRDRNRHR